MGKYRAFCLSLFLVLLVFAAMALFLVAEYNISRTGYTNQPALYRALWEMMEPFSQRMEPILRWLHLA